MSTGTRHKVLSTLLTNPKSTINELADAVGLNAISIRHHINNLTADGLVNAEEEKHGVGRPRQVFFLTEIGMEQFPTRYVRLTLRLLEQLKETVPTSMINNLFIQMAQELADELALDTKTASLSIQERLDLVKNILQNEGFTIDWEHCGEYYQIREISCPYYYIGQNHPEICELDQIIISRILETHVVKTQCILNGDDYCAYMVAENESAKEVA